MVVTLRCLVGTALDLWPVVVCLSHFELYRIYVYGHVLAPTVCNFRTQWVQESFLYWKKSDKQPRNM